MGGRRAGEWGGAGRAEGAGRSLEDNHPEAEVGAAGRKRPKLEFQPNHSFVKQLVACLEGQLKFAPQWGYLYWLEQPNNVLTDALSATANDGISNI